MQLERIVLGDDPASWEALGFRVERLDGGRGGVRLGSTVIELTGEGGGFRAWRLAGITDDLDGLATAAATGTDADRPPDGHPNGISRIDHVVVRSGDVDRTLARLGEAGLDLRGGRTTQSYGTPMRQAFLWAGDVILEVVGPADDEPTTEEPTSIFGLALVADDLDATGDRLGDLMGTPKEAVQEGRRIAGMRGKDVGVSLPLAVMSPHPGPRG